METYCSDITLLFSLPTSWSNYRPVPFPNLNPVYQARLCQLLSFHRVFIPLLKFYPSSATPSHQPKTHYKRHCLFVYKFVRNTWLQYTFFLLISAVLRFLVNVFSVLLPTFAFNTPSLPFLILKPFLLFKPISISFDMCFPFRFQAFRFHYGQANLLLNFFYILHSKLPYLSRAPCLLPPWLFPFPLHLPSAHCLNPTSKVMQSHTHTSHP